MTPPAVASTMMASASVEAPVTRISVATPTAVMSRSSPPASPVTEISSPPAVVVMVKASAPVPAEERTRDELVAPARAMVRSSAARFEVSVKFMSSAPSTESTPRESMVIPPVPESMSIPAVVVTA